MISRICIVSDAIRKPFDEGVKIFVYNLIKEFNEKYEVLALGPSDDFEEPIGACCKKAIPRNKLYIGSHLKNEIRSFKPDVIYYLPVAHATIYSFIRARVLKLYGRGVKTVLITLQPRGYTSLKKMLIPFIVPDLVLAQSGKTKTLLSGLGCTVREIQSGVNLKKFTPVDKDTKKDLRAKYGLPADHYIVLHVGHMSPNRNLPVLSEIQFLEGVQAVAVGSKTYPPDSRLVKELKSKGVMILTEYIENIAEIYQASDCYVFPVVEEIGCIEVPLSVFEAMACNLPVVATKFGGLPALVPEQQGFAYADSADDIAEKVLFVKKISAPETRKIAERFSWKRVAEQVVQNT